jgi:hypothetical protein
LHFILAPIAGAIAAASGYHGDATTNILLAVLGGGNALFIHSARTGLRAASTATTAGVANPFISVIEDTVAALFIIASLLAPWITALVLVLATVWLIRKLHLRRTKGQTP